MAMEQIGIVETIGILTIVKESSTDDYWYVVTNADNESLWVGKNLDEEAQNVWEDAHVDYAAALKRVEAESLAEARAFCLEHPGTMTVERVLNDNDKPVLRISGTVSAAELASARTVVAEARDVVHDEDECYLYGDASESVTLRGFTIDPHEQEWENYELHEIRMKTGEVRPTDSPTDGWELVLLDVSK